ncbi:MAG: hypothetical protein JWR32_4184 [Mycobacterium sp.]|nr:hypothetical protein [Mycobacterium sp.]
MARSFECPVKLKGPPGAEGNVANALLRIGVTPRCWPLTARVACSQTRAARVRLAVSVSPKPRRTSSRPMRDLSEATLALHESRNKHQPNVAAHAAITA